MCVLEMGVGMGMYFFKTIYWHIHKNEQWSMLKHLAVSPGLDCHGGKNTRIFKTKYVNMLTS